MSAYGEPFVKVSMRAPGPYGSSITGREDDALMDKAKQAGYRVVRRWLVLDVEQRLSEPLPLTERELAERMPS